MLTKNKLKNYLKKLIESIDSEALSNLEQKYQTDVIEKDLYSKEQQIKEKNSGKGWQLLDDIIKTLSELDDPKIHPQNLRYKYEIITEILTTQYNLKLIGEGQFRNVYSKTGIPFVVKVEKFQFDDDAYEEDEDYILSYGANKVEYNTYLNYGTDTRPRTDLFSKIYAYDKKNDMWIITEKVTTFSDDGTNNDVLLKIFQPIITLLSKVIKFIKTNRNFLNFPYYPFYNRTFNIDKNIFFRSNNVIEDIFEQANNNVYVDAELAQSIFDKCFDFIEIVTVEIERTNDLIAAFQLAIIQWLLSNFSIIGNDYDVVKMSQPKKLKFLISIFQKNFPDLKPTPDVAYFANFLRNKAISDIHFYNIGYRDMKNNPTEPWKNLIIIDFGEFGTNT